MNGVPEGFWISSGLALAVRATVVFCLALGLAWLARHRAAETRHHLWTTAFVLLLALPVLTWVGPSWELPLLPAVPAEALFTGETVAALQQLEEEPSPEAALPRVPPLASGRQGANETVWVGGRLAILVLLVWAAGCAAAFRATIVGVGRFRRLVAAARPVQDPLWLGDLELLCRKLSVREDVRLLIGPDVCTPMAGGFRRPVILLPAAAANGSAERRGVVLTHELVHVRRHDPLRVIACRAVLALYWFHPLSWLASRLAADSCEEACDEAVLAAGTRPSDYARHLLELAEGLGRQPAVAALAILHRSKLEGRIRSIVAARPLYRRGFAGLQCSLVLGVGVISVSMASLTPMEAEGNGPSPVPPAVRDCQVDQIDGRRSDFHFKGDPDGLLLCIGLAGDIVLREDNGGVLEVGEDGWLGLESVGERRHRLVVKGGTGGPEHAWSIDGRERPFDATAREWQNLVFTVIGAYLNHGGVNPPWRVQSQPSALGEGGIEERRRQLERSVRDEREALLRLVAQ